MVFPHRMSTKYLDEIQIFNFPAKTDTGSVVLGDIQPAGSLPTTQYSRLPAEHMGPTSSIIFASDLGIIPQAGPWDKYILKFNDRTYRISFVRDWQSHYLLVVDEVRM